ncbi:hypothetical protein DH2020_005005 [Rehmannia glutinosa]|uniref:Uncharacterized protein n=1 Tax=Rehmannia glutinosa TaxID=99300 RepID=A0ABR0XRN7_REHGL
MAKTTAGDAPKGLTFASFSDGYDDGFKPSDDANKYMTEIRSQGSKALKDTILAAAEQGRPSRASCTPSSSRGPHWWRVSSTSLARFSGSNPPPCWTYTTTISTALEMKSWQIRMTRPGKFNFLEIFHCYPNVTFRLSCFLRARTVSASVLRRYSFALPTFKEQLDTLEAEVKPKVLVNTFDALEANAIKAIDRYDLIGIGPLIPSAFLDGQDPSDKSFGGDLFQKSDENYVEWLNSKPKSSVVYVSFGSLLTLDKGQMEEIGKGLLDSGWPFLWVIRVNENANQDKEKTEDVENLSCLDELEKIGKIVAWCSQLESISCGVPVVAFPHWTDQGTNAKLIEDVWRTGVRVRVNEDRGMVESGEIRRCIEEVMDGGEKSRELRENAEKWKRLAREAMEENGSSNRNLKAFLEEVGDGC